MFFVYSFSKQFIEVSEIHCHRTSCQSAISRADSVFSHGHDVTWTSTYSQVIADITEKLSKNIAIYLYDDAAIYE